MKSDLANKLTQILDNNYKDHNLSLTDMIRVVNAYKKAKKDLKLKEGTTGDCEICGKALDDLDNMVGIHPTNKTVHKTCWSRLIDKRNELNQKHKDLTFDKSKIVLALIFKSKFADKDYTIYATVPSLDSSSTISPGQVEIKNCKMEKI